jgi:(E)-4-hydroxy-3-methylbut-2-enyl-diphosphate synthase
MAEQSKSLVVDDTDSDIVMVFDITGHKQLPPIRDWFAFLQKEQILNPVLLKKDFGNLGKEDFLINAAIDFGFFLVDGLVDGIWPVSSTIDNEWLSKIAFDILQASGERITKTEFIACPACGRTLFNIQKTLQNVKSRTSHLKGLKIAVMGCCVNGPGEMADAHYGYVGAGKDKVTLYKGQQIKKTGIEAKHALDELVELIKKHGDWQETDP